MSALNLLAGAVVFASMITTAPARVAYLGTSINAGSGNGAGGGSLGTANLDFDPVTLKANRVNLGGQMAFHIQRNLSYRAVAVATAATGGTYLSSANNATANSLLEWQVPRTIANRPTHAIINSGTNEAGGSAITPTQYATYKAQMLEVVRQLQQAGIIVIVSTIPPRPASATTKANVSLINKAWREVCALTGAYLWDLFSYCSSASNGFLANLNVSDQVHLDGTGVPALFDAACAEILPLFAGSHRPVSGDIVRSTAAAPTDNMIGGVFDGIAGSPSGTAINTAVTQPGTFLTNAVAGSNANCTFTAAGSKGTEAIGQRWIGKSLRMTCTGQCMFRHSVSDFATQLPPGSRVVIGCWLSVPAMTTGAARVGVRFSFADAGASLTYRSTLLDGSPGAFTTDALIMVEVTTPSVYADGTTPITQAFFDMGQNGSSATNNTLDVAHAFVARVA